VARLSLRDTGLMGLLIECAAEATAENEQ